MRGDWTRKKTRQTERSSPREGMDEEFPGKEKNGRLERISHGPLETI